MEDKKFMDYIRRATEVEYQICLWYQKNVDPKTRMALPKTRGYDILCPAVGNIEVKEDRLSERTRHYAFEIEDQMGNKSGIAATTAKEFVLVDESHVYRMKTTSLLFIIKECKERRMIQMGYTTKEGKRAWGYILPVEKIQFSPYVEELRRWF